MRHRPLPAELGDHFSVREASRAGVRPGRLRSTDLDKPFRGVRIQRHRVTATSIEARIQGLALAYSRAMPPTQFFAGATAAVLWGMPLPYAALRSIAVAGIDVGVFVPRQYPRGSGVRGRRISPAAAHVMAHPQLEVLLTSPASTWAALGATLDQYDLVAAGDAVVRERMFRDSPPPLATLDQLAAAMAATRRVGAPALRAALPRIRTRSASRRETQCRLILVDAGLPEPELNHSVLGADGRLFACVDLAYPHRRIAIEYEGEHHLLDPAQWARDLARYEALAAAGWFVIRVPKAHLADGGAALVTRVSAALAR